MVDHIFNFQIQLNRKKIDYFCKYFLLQELQKLTYTTCSHIIKQGFILQFFDFHFVQSFNIHLSFESYRLHFAQSILSTFI